MTFRGQDRKRSIMKNPFAVLKRRRQKKVQKKVLAAREHFRIFACTNVLLEFPYADPGVIQRYIREGRDREWIVQQILDMEEQQEMLRRERTRERRYNFGQMRTENAIRF